MEDWQPDRKRQNAARQYAAIRRRLFLAELALGSFFTLFLIVSGVAFALRDWLFGFLGVQAIVVAAMFLLLSSGYALLGVPLTLYSGFLLPHRFGLSTQTLAAWFWDLIKGCLVGGALGLIAVEVVYYLLASFTELWWLLAAVAMLLFTVVLSNLAPVLLVPLFFKLKPLSDEELAARLIGLANSAGTRVRGVYAIDMSSKTTAANAALMGIGNTRRIVLGDTLLARYDADEIETVLAHELGHHVHHDIPKGIAVQSFVTLVGFFLAHLVLRWAVQVIGYQSSADAAAMPLLALVLGALGVIAMPMSNAFSRHIETLADRYALRMTAKPEAFARVMVKLADQNLSEFAPPRWVELLFYDHPSAARRVALARRYLCPG